jgi:UDP-N-acetyl-D-galactosamine dehydrogenase
MAAHVASRLVQQLARNGRLNASTRVGILGMTFKENVPDIRNSKIVDLYNALGQYGITPVACDPMVDPEQMDHEYGIKLVGRDQFRDMDVLILAVPHRETMETIWEDLPQLVKNGGMVCDLKSVLDPKRLPADLLYWTL